MTIRYTDATERVLRYAIDEAHASGRVSVQPEDFLVGLLRHGKGLSANLLERNGVSIARLRDAAPRLASPLVDAGWRFDAPAAHAFKAAIAEARSLGRPDVSTDCLLVGLLEDSASRAVTLLDQLGAQPAALREELQHMLRYDRQSDHERPHLPRSTPVRIQPTRLVLQDGRRSHQALDFLSLHNIDLKELIAAMAGVHESRIDWPRGLDDESCYDVDAEIEECEGSGALHRLVLDAIGRRFHLAITRETRPVAVYILTAVDRPSSGRRYVGDAHGSLGACSWAAADEPAGLPDPPSNRRRLLRPPSGAPQSFSGHLDMSGLCDLLAGLVGSPFVNDTGLGGSYELRVAATRNTRESFFEALEAQAGLLVTPGERDVEMVVVRRR